MIASWLKHKAERSAQARALHWFTRLQSPDLCEKERAMFECWLAKSVVNQRAFIQIEAAWQESGALAFAVKPQPNTTRSKSDWLKLLGGNGSAAWLGSAAAVMVVVVVIVTQIGPQPQVFTTEQAPLEVTLEDGSQLTLQPNSRLEVSFSSRERDLELVRGEVFFDVAKDATRPFIIATPKGTVTVLGTKFAVSLFAAKGALADASSTDLAQPKVQVTVIEGRVAVEPQKRWLSLGPLAKVELTANQQLDFASAAKGYMPDRVNAKALLAWRQERLVYQGELLSAVLDDLSQYFDRSISLDLSDPQQFGALLQEEITAVIKLGSAEQAAQVLADSLGLELRVQANGNLVLH